MTATQGADRPTRLGGRPRLTILVRANHDVRDCVLSLAEGGQKLARGLAERIGAHTDGSVAAEVRYAPAGPAADVLAELEADPTALADADVLVLSIEPDVTARRTGTDVAEHYHSVMGNLAQLVKASDTHLVVFNGSTIDPADGTSGYQGRPEPPSMIIHRLDLALMKLSVLDGLSIIDVDRVVAEIGGRQAVESLLSYSPQVCDALCDEMLRVLDDYCFFEHRPLVTQVGRRSAGS
jgi:hypothetical protein